MYSAGHGDCSYNYLHTCNLRAIWRIYMQNAGKKKQKKKNRTNKNTNTRVTGLSLSFSADAAKEDSLVTSHKNL